MIEDKLISLKYINNKIRSLSEEEDYKKQNY